VRPTGVLGAQVALEGHEGLRPDAVLFGETASRVVVSCSPSDVAAVKALAQELAAPAREIGRVGGSKLVIKDLVNLDLVDAHERWFRVFEEMMGE
jgi:phosphoribosylformylglycinamidine synthase